MIGFAVLLLLLVPFILRSAAWGRRTYTFASTAHDVLAVGGRCYLFFLPFYRSLLS